MTDSELLIEISKRCKDLSFLAQVKRIVSKKLAAKTTFQESEIYNKVEFKKMFHTWSTEKLRYYYNSAESYSIEGNKYVDWGRAISNWAARDELRGLKFANDTEQKQVYKGNILDGNR